MYAYNIVFHTHKVKNTDASPIIFVNVFHAV